LFDQQIIVQYSVFGTEIGSMIYIDLVMIWLYCGE